MPTPPPPPPPQKQLNIAGVANVAANSGNQSPPGITPTPRLLLPGDTIGICYRRLACWSLPSALCSQMRSNWRYIWPQKMQRALRDRSLCEIWAQERRQAASLPPQAAGLSTTRRQTHSKWQSKPIHATPRHATPIQSKCIESMARATSDSSNCVGAPPRRIRMRMRIRHQQRRRQRVRNLTDDRD